MRYCPLLFRTPMSSGAPLHLISTSVSLCTVKPVLVKMEMVPSSEVFPSLINDVGKLVNVSAFVALFDNCGKGSRVTFDALHVSPFAVSTFFLMSVRWACMPLFYRLCSHIVRLLLSRT